MAQQAVTMNNMKSKPSINGDEEETKEDQLIEPLAVSNINGIGANVDREVMRQLQEGQDTLDLTRHIVDDLHLHGRTLMDCKVGMDIIGAQLNDLKESLLVGDRTVKSLEMSKHRATADLYKLRDSIQTTIDSIEHNYDTAIASTRAQSQKWRAEAAQKRRALSEQEHKMEKGQDELHDLKGNVIDLANQFAHWVRKSKKNFGSGGGSLAHQVLTEEASKFDLRNLRRLFKRPPVEPEQICMFLPEN